MFCTRSQQSLSIGTCVVSVDENIDGFVVHILSDVRREYFKTNNGNYRENWCDSYNIFGKNDVTQFFNLFLCNR